MRPVDVYRVALGALEEEPTYPRLPWHHRQAVIRAMARKVLREAIAEEEQIQLFVSSMKAATLALTVQCEYCEALIASKPYVDQLGRDFCNESCSDMQNERVAERIHERGC